MRKFFIKDNVCTPYKLILSRTNNFLVANGWASTLNMDEADTIIVGTCAAFHSLEQESIDMVRDLRNPHAEHVVFGCLPKVNPQIVKELGADRVVPASHWERVEALVENPVVRLEDVPETSEFRLKEDYRRYDAGKQFVLIETGCSSNCPFCPHKMGIGGLRSAKPDLILRQVRELTEEKGVHTIILTGNDTGSYGTDLEDGVLFPDLIEKVLEICPSLHLTQVNPNWTYKYRDRLSEILLNPKIKDFQCPVQSTSPRLLQMMERDPVVKELRPFFENIRSQRKDLLLRTDIMLGYPTATDDEEQDTLEYVVELFDECAVHGFEIFPHARIAKMDLPFYPQEEIDRRVDRAARFMSRFPILIHRGGQIYDTLVKIEQPKEELRHQKTA